MKEKSNATLRRAASLRCRTDAAIARLGKAVACYQRGAITAAELLREASAAADRAGTLELSAAELAATGSFALLRRECSCAAPCRIQIQPRRAAYCRAEKAQGVVCLKTLHGAAGGGKLRQRF